MQFTVNTLIDELDGSVTDGDVSLRDAIAAANAQPGGDTIDFDPSLSSGTILLTLGELQITESASITGDVDNNDTPDITIDAQGNSRVFNVSDGDPLTDGPPTDQNVILDGLVITGGNASGDFDLDDFSGGGGGIFTTENLTVQNSVISDNSASSAGSAVSGFAMGESPFYAGDITLIASTVTGNSGPEAVYGKADIIDSTISGNSGDGAFLREEGTIKNSTVADNGGSGIRFFAFGGPLTIVNSTISGNEDDGVSSFAVPDIVNSTISENGTGVYLYSGGIIRNSTITNNTDAGIDSLFGDIGALTSTIVAGNGPDGITDIVANSSGDPSESDDLDSGGNNLIGNGDSLVGLEGSDIVGTAANPIDPMLGDLQDNGGPTETQALLPGSPAINAGSNPANLLSTDQRGFGFNREVDGQTDIGAFESEPAPNPIDIELSLFNASTDTVIAPIVDGGEIVLDGVSSNELTIVASFDDDSPVESVFFDLNNGQTTEIQSDEPLALFGDVGGDLTAGTIFPGENSLSIDLYSEDGLGGTLLSSVTSNFTIVDDVTGPSAVEVGLFNADDDTLIQVLEDGTVIQSSDLPTTNLAIVVTTNEDGPLANQVESVAFDLNNGQVVRVESFEPLSLFGDIGGDLTGGMLQPGSNLLELGLYSADGAQGQLLDTVTVNFTIQ